MKPVIVGTAGHIDHGKTALVKALTGIDADRLAEEKRRGITIDLGFAHLDVAAPDGGTLRLGFVDVPGHERFVRNMLAGVGGIDFVLLVIAADESIKPQTREHFDICRLLQIRRGMVVLTKADTVDAETLEVVRLEVEEFLRGSFLEGAPIVAASSLTGAGIPALKQELARLASAVQPKQTDALFRLPIDRVFSMKGFGTVVTGTLLAGAVHKEDELEVQPGGRRVRVRGLQVHGAAADTATAGQRTAINVVGATTDELARGMELVAPGRLRATNRCDVELTLLPGAKNLRPRSRVHLHVHTAETVAQVAVYDAEALGAKNGERTANARLQLADPVLLLPGDRFIIRQFSPVVTIGGGVVLDAAPLTRRRQKPEQLAAFLASMATGSADDILVARVARRGTAGLTLADAVAETGWTLKRVAELANALVAAKRLARLGDSLIAADAFAGAKAAALAALNAFHAANPLVAGISREELREKIGVSPDVLNGILQALVAEKKVEVSGETVRAAGRGVQMKDEEAASKQQIERAFAEAGLKVPLLNDVLAGLKIDRARAQKIMTLLLRDRVLVKVSEDLVFHREALEHLREAVKARKAAMPQLDVAGFKEQFGLSRKYAIPLLEWLDRERVTRRMGEKRVIL